MDIQFVKHNDINLEKWDKAIHTASNALVYALSWYLDIVSPDWNALILGDYDIIMPLTHKRKYGIEYLIQPAFTQQLGVFYKENNRNLIYEFIKMLHEKYKYININLNYENCRDSFDEFKLKLNYVLNLNESYESIYKNYSTNTKRNIKKANKEHLILLENIDYQKILDFKKKYANEGVTRVNYRTLENILKTTTKQRKGEGLAIYTNSNNILATTFLIKEFNRIIFLISVSNDKGKEKSAMFFLVDHIIKKYSGQNYIFDFEGSSVSGIKRFFEGFGAQQEIYPKLKVNNLSWPLNLIKK